MDRWDRNRMTSTKQQLFPVTSFVSSIFMKCGNQLLTYRNFENNCIPSHTKLANYWWSGYRYKFFPYVHLTILLKKTRFSILWMNSSVDVCKLSICKNHQTKSVIDSWYLVGKKIKLWYRNRKVLIHFFLYCFNHCNNSIPSLDCCRLYFFNR